MKINSTKNVALRILWKLGTVTYWGSAHSAVPVPTWILHVSGAPAMRNKYTMKPFLSKLEMVTRMSKTILSGKICSIYILISTFISQWIACYPQPYASNTGAFLWILGNFLEHLFYRTIPVAASFPSEIIRINSRSNCKGTYWMIDGLYLHQFSIKLQRDILNDRWFTN